MIARSCGRNNGLPTGHGGRGDGVPRGVVVQVGREGAEEGGLGEEDDVGGVFDSLVGGVWVGGGGLAGGSGCSGLDGEERRGNRGRGKEADHLHCFGAGGRVGALAETGEGVWKGGGGAGAAAEVGLFYVHWDGRVAACWGECGFGGAAL